MVVDTNINGTRQDSRPQNLYWFFITYTLRIFCFCEFYKRVQGNKVSIHTAIGGRVSVNAVRAVSHLTT